MYKYAHITTIIDHCHKKKLNSIK